MKKILTFAISFILTGIFSLNAFAGNIGGSAVADNNAIIRVQITDLDTGRKYSLDQEQIKTMTTSKDNLTTDMITTNIVLPGENNGIAPFSSVTDGGATTRITFNINHISSGKLLRITGATGSFAQLDKAFTISGRMVKLANFHDYGNYIRTYSCGSSFSCSGFSNWVDTTSATYVVGGYAKCNIARSGKSWELRCTYIVSQRGMGGYF